MPSMVFHPVEAPADRSLGRWVLDGFITLAAIALSLPPILGREDGHAHPWAFVLVLLTTLPLIVRRCWPVPVFATIVTAALVAGLFDHNAVAGPAVIVALYTVAAMSERRDAVVAAAVVVLITVTLTLVFAGRDWWFDSIFLTGLIAAALALGLYAATRRAYLAELHDRAERAERERDQQGELAASAERARIAREMHDIVAHHLTVMVALSEGAVAAAPEAPERARDTMRLVSETGRQALADTRRLLGVLRDRNETDARDPIPDLSGLDDLIETVRAAGLPVQLRTRGAAADLAPGVQLAIYRLVQEALTNTMKHAGADARAVVTLAYLPGEVGVTVADDGVGAGDGLLGRGGGMTGMRERVAAYGGVIESGAGTGGGWTVSATIPVDGHARSVSP